MRTTASSVIPIAAFAVIWLAVVLWARPPETQTPSASESTPNASAQTQTTEPSVEADQPSLLIAATGAFAERALQDQEFAFSSILAAEGEAGRADVDPLPSEPAVLDLVTSNPDGFDVIEVGFRLDVISGALDEHLAPIDPVLVPSLARLDPALRLPANGIVPALDGVLAMFADPAAPSRPARWSDLADIARSGGTVVIPGPPLSLSVLFVWTLGDGDPTLGMERYEALVDAGATPVSNASELADVVIGTQAVGAWSSPGVFDIDRGVEADLDLVFPVGGAVPLPAFTAILADSDQIALAHRWLEFRLSDEVQQAMTFTDVATGFGQRDPVPWGPVIDSGHPPNRAIGFDPAEIELRLVDWAAVAGAVDQVTAALVELVGG